MKLEPRRDASVDPSRHYLIHACRWIALYPEVRLVESSDLFVARTIARQFQARGWTTLIFKSLPGAARGAGGGESS